MSTSDLARLVRGRRDTVLIGDGIAFTGEQLDAAADALAETLARANISEASRVALLFGNSPSFVVSLLATAKLGASAVLLSTHFTERDVADSIARTGASIILSQRDATAVNAAVIGAPGHQCLSATLGTIAVWQTVPADRPAPAAPGEATVQFTSGVSGRSKIIARSKANLLDELEGLASGLGLGSSDRTLCPAPLFHAYGLVNGCLLPLFAGGQVVLVDWFVPSVVLNTAQQCGPSIIIGVPAMYKAMADTYNANPANVRTVRVFSSAGAPLTAAIAGAFRTRFGNRLHQQYGSTETGAIAMNLGADQGVDVLSVGRALPGRQIELRTEGGDLVAPGEIGEVVVRSGAVARGYLDDDDLTARRFRDGWYHTGDLGRLTSQGDLILAGRHSGFINVAGLKIDPTEIENVLSRCDAVAECAVVSTGDSSSGEAVLAIIVTRAPTTSRKIQQFCRRHLAAFKVPRYVRFVDALPRSPTGKILTKDLATLRLAAPATLEKDPHGS